jgi:hypothetical protein
MTTTLSAQPRRQAAAASRPPRDLPVLFHLIDVSRPRGYGATQSPSEPADYTLGSRLPEAESTARGETSVSNLLADAFDLQVAASLAETGGLDASPAETSATGTAAIDTDAANREPTTTSTDEQAEASDEIADAAQDSERAASAANNGHELSPLDSPPPAASEDAVALRQRAEERQRKRAAAARDDWFSTHGKFIAIGFFIALVATIFLARQQRKPAGPRSAP